MLCINKEFIMSTTSNFLKSTEPMHSLALDLVSETGKNCMIYDIPEPLSSIALVTMQTFINFGDAIGSAILKLYFLITYFLMQC